MEGLNLEEEVLEGTTEGWESDYYLVRIRSLSSILPIYIIISNTWGHISLWWVKHGGWEAATKATDRHMIKIVTTQLSSGNPREWIYSWASLLFACKVSVDHLTGSGKKNNFYPIVLYWLLFQFNMYFAIVILQGLILHALKNTLTKLNIFYNTFTLMFETWLIYYL